MTTREIANRLRTLCDEGKFEDAQKELYARDAVSIEQEESPAFAKETKGLDAIIEKGHVFEKMVEKVHGIKVSEPMIAGNSFVFQLDMDTTMKGRGRSNMSELCLYQVKDGKIVSEEFFM
jgi:hypothetical protein